MTIKQIFKDIMTSIDGESFDVSRVVMTANALILIPVLLAGISCYIYGWFCNKPFDIQTFFNATLTYVGGVGTLLMSGAASILMKKSTEPSVVPDPSPK